MNTGMLWFDNDPKTTLADKIERAVSYYRHKYGREPNTCLIHPSMLPVEDNAKNYSVVVRSYRSVLPGHLWIGIETRA